jgi:hypothetical protein
MKISQEVREFARLNPSPLAGEGDSAPAALRGERGQDKDSMHRAETFDPDVNASFAQMSKRFHDEGGELYVPAD